MWEDVEGQESFPVSAGFELITHGLYVYTVHRCPLISLTNFLCFD